MENDAMQRHARSVKLPSLVFCAPLLAVWLPAPGQAQVNSGSNGSDGVFNPTTNVVINMASHPSGIYQYTSVNIPSSVAVTFTPNANNTPVVWLVQSNCVIAGFVSVPGQSPSGASDTVGGTAGPGGWGGGSGGSYASPGQGPGGGGACATNSGAGGSFGAQGQSPGSWAIAGPVYGNSFLLPLIGGSGGGGGSILVLGGGGGGGAILIAASGSIQLAGGINASGGSGAYNALPYEGSGGGSGGGVRLVTASFSGTGSVNAQGGGGSPVGSAGGNGRIRIDAYQNTFGGSLSGVVSQGFQPIIFPTSGQGAQLTISSIAGVAVSPTPTGILATPDAVVSAQQANPIPVVVSCVNIPLSTPITVSVKSANGNGSSVSAVGYNNTGTLASSTATVSLNMPRGGGIIWATAATGN